jgi:hypothetical protein
MWRQSAIVAAVTGLTMGCGTTGWIRFQELDPGAETIHQTPTQVYAIDCQEQGSGPSAKASLGDLLWSGLADGVGKSPQLALILAPVIIVGVLTHPPTPPVQMVYALSCTKEGGAIPWKVLGAFQAGEAARDKWDRYSREVVEKAEKRGCPAVLVRRAPPAASSRAEAVGALCVDTEQPSGVSGPLRLVSVRTGPLHVLADGEPITVAAR